MTSPSTALATTSGLTTRRRSGFHLGDAIIPVFTAVAIVYLLIPIAYTVAFSFNDYFKSNIIWNGFTWGNWTNPCGAPQVCESFSTSLQIGAVATVVSTALGTLLAVGLVRFRFRGRAAVNLLVFLPMSTPEIVLGSALAAQFLWVRATYGFWTIVAAHVMFCISFVVVTVKARVASLDPALEEAAADLYASPLAAFWRVTFPLLLPGIGAAALLAFSLSFDDYIVTNLNAGSVKTFPMFIYISHQKGIPAQANVLATVMFLLALLLVAAAQVWSVGRRRHRDARSRRSRLVRAAEAVEGGAAAQSVTEDQVATSTETVATTGADLAPRARVPARPATLVARRRPQVVPTEPTADHAQVFGLSVQSHRPWSVAAVGLLGVGGGVLAVLTALVRIPNAYDADLDAWLVTLGVAMVVALAGALLLRGSAAGRTVYAVVVGLVGVGLVLAVTVFDVGVSLRLVVGLAVAVACLGLVFTRAAGTYFHPPS